MGTARAIRKMGDLGSAQPAKAFRCPAQASHQGASTNLIRALHSRTLVNRIHRHHLLDMNIIDLHQRMLNNVFLNVEILLNDRVNDLSEYDVQGLMYLYFKRALINSDYSVERERFGKADCVVLQNGHPHLLYELKTYYKKHERPLQSHYKKDLEKLFDSLGDYHKSDVSARAFFILAGRKSKFKSRSLSQFSWLNKRLNDRERNWTWYQISKNKRVHIRPGPLLSHGRGLATSWEVKL